MGYQMWQKLLIGAAKVAVTAVVVKTAVDVAAERRRKRARLLRVAAAGLGTAGVAAGGAAIIKKSHVFERTAIRSVEGEFTKGIKKGAGEVVGGAGGIAVSYEAYKRLCSPKRTERDEDLCAAYRRYLFGDRH